MKTLIFEDLKTGETWEHNHNDWILQFCNFKSTIHPSLLRIGQKIEVKDEKGHTVRISCKRNTESWSETFDRKNKTFIKGASS